MAKNKNDSQFSDDDEVESGLVKFEKVGDGVEGILVDVRTVKSQIDGSDQKMYDIQVADGGVMAVFGRKVIDQKMKTAKIGQLVKMVFASEGKPKKKGMSGFKLIKVYLKNAPMSASDEIDADEVGE